MLGYDLDIGLMFKIMAIIGGIILFVYGIYLSKKKYIKNLVEEAKDDVWSSILHVRDLPVKDKIKFVGDRDIILYDIDLYDVENKTMEDMPYEYGKLIGIINKHIKFETTPEDDGGFSLDIALVDFREKEYENQYLEIIDLVTNFNLAQFIFKGDDTFKLVNLESNKIDRIKEHADYMITKIFKEVIRSYTDMADDETKHFYEDAYKQVMFK